MIARLLGRLVPTSSAAELDVVVIANGCTDDTAEVASSFGPTVRVLSIPAPSKREALVVGNIAASGFPRIYVDADVELRLKDVRVLANVLKHPGVFAATTELGHDFAGCSWPVRWYYDVWERLPEVQKGLFGRGVVALNEAGYNRLTSLPPMMADDLLASLAFSDSERVVARGARVVVHPPLTLADLLRIRVRAVVGVAEVERTEGAPPSTAATRPRDLLAMVRAEPNLAPRVALFLAVAVIARLRARRALRQSDFSTWLRDESTRRGAETLAVSGQPRSDSYR